VPEPTEEPTAVPEPTEEPTAVPEPTEEPTAVPEPTEEPETPAPEPTSIVLENGYEVTYVSYEEEEDGTQLWTYEIDRNTSRKALSNWLVQVPASCGGESTVVTAPSYPGGLQWIDQDTNDPNAGFTGSKWENYPEDYTTGTYVVRVEGNVAIGTTQVFAKGGTNTGTGSLPGPVCAP
jgi:hypothetical protein